MFASTVGSRLSSVVGVASLNKIEAGFQRREAKFRVLLGRQINNDQAVNAGAVRVRQKLVNAVHVDRIVVAHEDDRGRIVAAPEFTHQRKGPLHVLAGRKRA